ncbi:UNVERIFIED_CONTAM: ABC transporter ATP-binding protein [Clostridioides difficile]|uniref:methionine ABC transporter ATP-binding protein n=1 Tax=Clostridioides difficile TaxID=1496 RepID=UPI000825E9B0|nr:ATP-binding cassette domain-containing protein [Clostridioides difficile]MDO0136275.1 ATP-binding cassette domain-containing protein [Clostridioides difficile]MDX5649342.1 ATP-binding cassette domain-containing protein [Clostridioides difficile]HBG7259458.1 ATP-binding cassette domain-containing protein [Clostridioides difficile]HBY2627056.1 ATP-binding cassette domain-containing protein [Clostridioides difficile]HBY3615730.1 ATP-binding cassette domain-containing protein [Clostridioides di
MIKISGLKKKFDNLEVLKNINLTIEDGDIYGLVGRSGAGKSTLLRCINGLTDYQEGSLTVDGKEVKDFSSYEMREFRRGMGMIFQQFSLLNRKTVYQNIATPMQCWNYPKDEIDRKVKELLELVGLSDKMDAKPRNLSGGQKQRVAIARALSMDSKVLLCDEATSALDPKTTLSILELLKKINRERGITIIIVTHQMEVVRNACNKISILENGEIAAQGETKEIFAQRPKALQNLLGEESTKLPTTGRNISIAHYVNDISDGMLITQMSADLNTIFSVVDGQILNYSDDKFGTVIINVTEEQFPAITKYLDDRNYEWREIVSASDESEVDDNDAN